MFGKENRSDMDITLVVLAAGIGSRYGAGIKQLEHVGPGGEIIMDYSVHDAIRAGFNRVVFILRPDIREEFMEAIGNRMEARFQALGVKWAYAYQETKDLPEGRTKPWGTGQAVLCCAPLLDGPFAVINADDYYGKQAFQLAYEFLSGYRPEEPGRYGMIGFVLKNTLSDVGGVTRGVCEVDGDGDLAKVTETRGIVRTADGGAAVPDGDGWRQLDPDSLVSMNMWLLTPAFLDGLGARFDAFRAGLADPRKGEFLLPEIVDAMVKEGRATVRVLRTTDQWFGITYQEDRTPVTEAFRDLIARGEYSADLFSDL